MVVKFPCKTYNRSVAKNHHSVQSDTWSHCNYNKRNKQPYKLLQNEQNSEWFCIICTMEL